MARKGEKAKSRKSPDTPRRVGRPPRRRKKSDSEESEEKKPVEPPPEIEQGESSDSVRMRRSTRRQGDTVPAAAAAEVKPQSAAEWKEDESFWSKEETESTTASKVDERKDGDEGATVWKVQTSNGSGGEIQKLRICRQRPGGAGSDSADSSMSPAKDSSPLHKRPLKKESQKSPLVERNVSDIELPTGSGSTETQDSSLPNQASGIHVPEVHADVPEGQKAVQYFYETQPSIDTNETVTPTKVNEPDTSSTETKEPNTLPSANDVTPEVEQTVKIPSPVSATNKKEEDSEQTEDVSPSDIQLPDDVTNPGKTSESGDNKPNISEDNKDKISATESTDRDKDVPPETQISSDKGEDVPKSDKSSEENVESKVEIPLLSTSDESNIRPVNQGGTIDKRRKSDGSIKSAGTRSRSSSVSLVPSANSESNEPLLEISANKSPIHDGKEEGEIVEDEKPETPQESDKKKIIKLRTKSEEASTSKVIIQRRSTGDSIESTSKPGSGGPATTAKKHPLITGPEPDDSPALRRRKLNLTTTRTVITPGGATRQVRSIPGEALKAVLLPETEKKDKEKRPKIKIKDDKEESGGGEKSFSETKLNKVEDVREILKQNRSAERKVIEHEKETRPAKSPIKTSQYEIKTPTRKVSIGAAPIIEDVKASKPARSKSPGDTKATQILFISNLVRPFTAGQLKELLARTGTISSNGFFIDKIKSKCFVKYIDVEMAIETRHALNGVRWPVSNPKVLKVAYALDKELKFIQDSAEGEIVDDISIPRASSGSGWLSSEQAVSKDKEKSKVSIPTTREWDRGKPKSGADGDVIFVNEYKTEEKYRQAASVLEVERNERHRDREKVVKEEHSRNHSQSERERDKRKRRSPLDIENSPPPLQRKFKKKDYDAPAKLLDDLFRKTKTSPCLYWLPLSAEQIAVKEETRRKHMAEHERRMAELKKSAQQWRDKERDRDRERRRK